MFVVLIKRNNLTVKKYANERAAGARSQTVWQKQTLESSDNGLLDVIQYKLGNNLPSSLHMLRLIIPFKCTFNPHFTASHRRLNPIYITMYTVPYHRQF